MVFTFNEIGNRRIGLRGERGRCRLASVESLPADESHTPQTIFTAETQLLTGEGRILRADDVIAHSDRDAVNRMEIEFLTPTSIKVDGRWTQHLTFEHFMRNLLRRIRFLSYFHCGEDLDVDAKRLLEAAKTIKHQHDFQRLRADRWSYRAAASIPMGGFIGRIRFEGNLTPFLPFILLGAHLHIGHHTAFGHGQYRLKGMNP